MNVRSIAALFLMCASFPVVVHAQTLVRLSVNSSGQEAVDSTPGSLGVYSREAVISGLGEYVAFTSNATNLVACSLAGTQNEHVYRVNLLTGEVLLVDDGTSDARTPSISDDGQKIVYIQNGEVYLSDLSGTTGCTNTVYTQILAGYTLSGTCSSPVISGNGRYVAFVSTTEGGATPLPNSIPLPMCFPPPCGPGACTQFGPETPFEGVEDVFYVDLNSSTVPNPTVRWISYALNTGLCTAVSDQPCVQPTISRDGQFVAFDSWWPLLNGELPHRKCYLWDASASPGYALTSIAQNGATQADNDTAEASLSPDGNYVVFTSSATNLIASDNQDCPGVMLPGDPDAFMKNLVTGSVTRISLSYLGAERCDSSVAPSVSDGGLQVAFYDTSGGITADLTAHPFGCCYPADVYTRDPSAVASPVRISAGNNSLPNPSSAVNYHEAIGPDGMVVFSSSRTDLVPNDTNGGSGSAYAGEDIFLWAPPAPSPNTGAYCFGDGTNTACPCSNNSTPTANLGCLNSLNLGGSLGGTATTESITSDTLVLTGAGMPNNSALYFQGTSISGLGVWPVYGDGLRCVSGAVIRLAVKSNVLGTSQYPVGADPVISVRGLVPSAGAQRYYQVWYRNSTAFCTPSTFNLTNGYGVVWTP